MTPIDPPPAPRQAQPPTGAAPRRPTRALVGLGLALAGAAAGSAYLLSTGSVQSTDAAYLKADETQVAAQLRGRVVGVLVRDHARVQPGDPLVRIDGEEPDTRVQLAEADLRNAQAALQAARATLASLGAEERVADSNMRVAQASIAAADAHRKRALVDRDRYDALLHDGAVAARDAELARVAAVSAEADGERSAMTLAASRNQVALVHSRGAVQAAALAQAEAALARSLAALQLARQEQAHTLVRAPVGGTVGALQVRVGDYVQPASRLLALVPLERLYVVAYFKETQVARMAAGQRARVEVDGWPELALTATVDSLAPGTGSQFSLLPFEPGTGNFTKMVQRVPVRLQFDAGQDGAIAKLRPGLSSTVTVHVGRKGDIGGHP